MKLWFFFFFLVESPLMAVICNNLVMPSSEYYQMKAFVEGNDCKLHANFNSAGINQYGNRTCAVLM